ncbi:MAG: DUF1573 domain-containing protein [Planctomycetes bacterium]|nr:DUF1573 domain-containing protein [Planctomycetota bacterium]
MCSALHFCTLALAVLCLPLAGCGKPPAHESGTLEDGPVQVEQARIVLDPVPFGESRQGRFLITNHAETEQTIERIGPASCSCTTLRLFFPDRKIGGPIELTGRAQEFALAPGERAEIEVTFDSSRLRRPVSRRNDSFAVIVHGSRSLVLEYAIDIWTPFWVEPWSIELGRVGVREQATGFAAVKAHDAEDSFDLIVPETVKGWTINTRPGKGEGADFVITFTAPEELPQGPFDLQVPIRTDAPSSPTLHVWLRGIAVPNLDWSPRRIAMIPDANHQAVATVNLISRTPTRPLGLRAVAFEGLPAEFADGIVAQTRTVTPEQAFAVDLRITRFPPERLEGALVLVTDDPDQPRISIPLVLRPKL